MKETRGGFGPGCIPMAEPKVTGGPDVPETGVQRPSPRHRLLAVVKNCHECGWYPRRPLLPCHGIHP